MSAPAGQTPDRDSRLSKAASFGGAAAALGVAAVVARIACPGGCPACTACAQTVVPAATSALAVGAALTGSYAIKKRSKRAEREPETPSDPDGSR